MDDCIFCKIAHHEINAEVVYEDDYVVAFNDISKKAKVHVLIIPKVHIANFEELSEENKIYFDKILEAVKKVSSITHINEDGYRIVNNCKENGGQEVDHLHFHILGGEKLSIG